MRFIPRLYAARLIARLSIARIVNASHAVRKLDSKR
jgi:hypothetical protein